MVLFWHALTPQAQASVRIHRQQGVTHALIAPGTQLLGQSDLQTVGILCKKTVKKFDRWWDQIVPARFRQINRLNA